MMNLSLPISFLKIAKRFFLLGLLTILISCTQKKQQQPDQIELVQISTIDALMQANYDGVATLDSIAQMGDFGIGTFHALDGELILLDGKFYQCNADGDVNRPDLSTTTPFASITKFRETKKANIRPCTFPELKLFIDSLTQSPNLFYAIKLHGNFERIKVRSVPAQQKPYRPLTQVTQNQPEFGMVKVNGTLIGFYCPAFVRGINVPGYHLHFLSDDHSFGGHVLEFELNKGKLSISQINQFKMILPDEGSFLDTDLTNDLSKELEQVEGNNKH